jgi:hypothetical protein
MTWMRRPRPAAGPGLLLSLVRVKSRAGQRRRETRTAPPGAVNSVFGTTLGPVHGAARRRSESPAPQLSKLDLATA